MNLFEAILLGALQGATEFLPVSSSGHLKLGAAALGIEEPKLLFDIILHVGSLVAVCLIYRQAIIDLLKGLWQGSLNLLGGKGLKAALEPSGMRLGLLIVASTIPTGLMGLLVKDYLEGPLISLPVVGAALIVNGFVLLFSRRAGDKQGAASQDQEGQQSQEDQEGQENAPAKKVRGPVELWRLGLGGALVVGLIQGFAIMPGLSRSGLTITTCLMLGMEREQAARFSFLLSIPAILGALVLKFDPEVFMGSSSDVVIAYVMGAVSACVVGALCLLFLLKLLRQARFFHFAWYCFLVGAIAIGWSFLGQ